MRKTVLEDVLLELKAHSSIFPGVIVLTVILEMPGELSAMELLP